MRRFFLVLITIILYVHCQQASDNCTYSFSMERETLKISCGFQGLGAISLRQILNESVAMKPTKVDIEGVGINEIPENLTDELRDVKCLRLSQAPDTTYEVNTGIVRNLESLELHGMRIDEIRFYESYPNIREFRIIGSNIGKVDQSFKTMLPNVKVLVLSYSGLSSLDVLREMCSLEQIFLNGNDIDSLETDESFCWQNLVVIDVMRNKFKSFKLNKTHLPAIETIKLSNHDANAIAKDLDLPTLHSLSIHSSTVKGFDVTNIKNLLKLTILELLDGELVKIPQGNTQTNTSITFLGLSFNKIESIGASDLQQWQELTYLYLDNNRISTIADYSFDNLLKLQHLDLHANNVKQFSPQLTATLKSIRFATWDSK